MLSLCLGSHFSFTFPRDCFPDNQVAFMDIVPSQLTIQGASFLEQMRKRQGVFQWAEREGQTPAKYRLAAKGSWEPVTS